MEEAVLNYAWAAGDAAFGAPGVSPKWTSSSKDLVGTAYSASSRVWWTTSHGILNEIYFPTIDSPQLRDMELLFTDGKTFFAEEKRDFTSEIELIDPDALAVKITNTCKNGKIRLVKHLFSDPHYPTVLMHVSVEGDEETLKTLQAYALISPHLGVGGAGNNARGLDIAGQNILLGWKDNISLAFGVSGGFKRTSCGYAGKSDGWQDLHEDFTMDWEFAEALDGNVAMTGEIDLTRSREFTLCVAMGIGNHGALSSLMQSLATPVEDLLGRFIEQWHRVQTPPELKGKSGDGGHLLRVSHAMLLAHEDKSYAGAFIASASIPWGQAKGDEDLGGYHLVWTRDMVQTSTALLACGKPDTARRALVYLACSQRSDGGFAQNFWVNGSPYWAGIQLDEVAFPIVLAWRLWKADALGDFDALTFCLRAAGFLVRQAPITQQERWEEAAGYSPSTLAVVITAFICAAEMARAYKRDGIARFLEEHADWIESNLENWTATQNGTLVPGIKRHYMRIRPPQCNEPYAQPNCADNVLHINNREPGEQADFPAESIVDAGFLELVRYGVRAADDPLIVDSVKVVDAVLRSETEAGEAWHRYNHDGYGTGQDGAPFLTHGQGGCWPLLGGERAHYELAAGRDITARIAEYERFASGCGMLPEQIWDGPDMPDKGLKNGHFSGSAMPLVWAHAEYVKLLRSATDGKVFDLVPVVAQRYLKDRPKSRIEVWKRRRHTSTLTDGNTLRITAGEPFTVTWSGDGWKTVNHLDAGSIEEAGWFADLPSSAAIAADGQERRILFTLYWPQEARWEGADFTITVVPAS